jgi:pyruvate/2-oxoglutarate/acetoin dehydrogenase E1 component
MSKYSDQISNAMDYLSNDPRTIFLGQAVVYPGTIMSPTLKNVSAEKKIEMPVAEDLQMGVSLGLALGGFIPVSIYPRWNFLILGLAQLVNHVDKIVEMSQGGYRPKLIIRTGIGAAGPLNPGCQHLGDFTDALRLMLTNTEVIRLDETEQIMPSYEKALTRTDGRSTILVEWGDRYNDK